MKMHGDETCFTSRFLVRRDRLMGFVRKEEVQVEGIMVMGLMLRVANWPILELGWTTFLRPFFPFLSMFCDSVFYFFNWFYV